MGNKIELLIRPMIAVLTVILLDFVIIVHLWLYFLEECKFSSMYLVLLAQNISNNHEKQSQLSY